MKRIFKDTAVYSFGSLLPKSAGIILMPIYTTYLSEVDYGRYALAAKIAAMVGMLMVLGQDGALALFYRRKDGEEDPRDILFSVVVFNIAFATAVLAILLAVGPYVTPWLAPKDPGFTYNPFVITALLMAWATVPLALQQAVNRAKGQPGIHTAFQVAQFTLNTAFTILFVVVLGQGGFGSLKGTFLGTLFVLPAAFFLIVREWRPKFSRTALKKSLDFGLPLVPHAILGGYVLQFGDQVLISRFLGMGAVGLYSFAYQLAMTVNLLTQSINRAWSPIYYDLAGSEEGPKILPRLTSIYASVVAAAALGFTLFMPDLVFILANKRFWAAAPIMPVIAAGYFFFAMYMVVSTPIFYARKTRWIPALSGSAAIFNIAINLYMIPTFGIAGAAWATFMAYLIMAAGARFLSGKLGAKFEDGRLLTVVAVYLVGFAATYGIGLLSLPVLIDIGVKIVLLAVLLALFVPLRVVTPDELRSALDRVKQRRAKKTTPSIEEARIAEERDAEDIGATGDTTGFDPDDAR